MSNVPDGQSNGSADSSFLGPPPKRRKRGRLLHCLFALVIFIAGAITGGAVTVYTLKRVVQQLHTHPEKAVEHVAGRLRRHLDLTDAQYEQVRSILTRRHGELEDIRCEVSPRVRAVLDAAHEEIAAVLDDHQRESWVKHYEHLIQEWFPPLPAESAGD